MLIIRRQQMEVLESMMRSEFEQRILVHLRTEIPAATRHLTDEDLQNMIQQGIRRARDLGIDLESDLEVFLTFFIRYGPTFDSSLEHLEIAEIMSNSNLTGSEKMCWLQDLLEIQEVEK